ncbi:MAG: sulfatase [Eubacteriales bacterium]
MKKKPNVLFFGIDSCRSLNLSLCGYERQTTPHIDRMAEDGVNFVNCFSPSIPTPPGYSSLLTGRDCFGTGVVTLRNVPRIPDGVSLQEVLGENGYNTTCIGFDDGSWTHGFQKYISYPSWGPDRADGRSHKAENMNDVAIPELKRLAAEDKPFFLFLRHMDPHSPYLPPFPFDRMFHSGDECDPENKSLENLYNFKPFRDYFCEWFPEGCTDAEYINAQYDGAIAYMDACIQRIFTAVSELGIEDETLIVLTSDHGETLDEHDCYYDHHGLYEGTLHVPLVFKLPGVVPSGCISDEIVQQKDVMPTILDILNIKTKLKFDGRSLVPIWNGGIRESEPEMYLTEATWMRKHGWRTPEWKLIVALEPDFHYKPSVELYNLIKDPLELNNVADKEPAVVKLLTKRMEKHIASRKKHYKRENPIDEAAFYWNDLGRPFESSDEAYNTMHIGDPAAAQKLQQQK